MIESYNKLISRTPSIIKALDESNNRNKKTKHLTLGIKFTEDYDESTANSSLNDPIEWKITTNKYYTQKKSIIILVNQIRVARGRRHTSNWFCCHKIRLAKSAFLYHC